MERHRRGRHFEGLRAGDTPDTFPEFSAKNGLWTPPYQISLNGELAYHQLPKSNDENYIFDGWQSSDGRFFLTIADAAKALMTEPADGEGITLTATWIYAQVTIKFDPGAGEPVLDEYGNSLLAPKTAVPYTVVTLPSSLSATRHRLYARRLDARRRALPGHLQRWRHGRPAS